MNPEWKEHPRYKGYMVSKGGEIISPLGRWLYPTWHPRTKTWILCIKTGPKSKKLVAVKHLVAETFLNYELGDHVRVIGHYRSLSVKDLKVIKQ